MLRHPEPPNARSCYHLGLEKQRREHITRHSGHEGRETGYRAGAALTLPSPQVPSIGRKRQEVNLGEAVHRQLPGHHQGEGGRIKGWGKQVENTQHATTCLLRTLSTHGVH